MHSIIKLHNYTTCAIPLPTSVHSLVLITVIYPKRMGRNRSQRHYSSVQMEFEWSLLPDGTVAKEITVPFNFFTFSPAKDLAPFSLRTPQKNPLWKRQIIKSLISAKSANVVFFAGSAVLCPTRNLLYIWKKIISGVNNVRTYIRVE